MFSVNFLIVQVRECYIYLFFVTYLNTNYHHLTFDLKRFQLEPTEWNDYNSDELYVQPKNKTIIYFPAEIFHKIEENKSNLTRYSLAFNFVPTGVIGQGDSQVIL